MEGLGGLGGLTIKKPIPKDNKDLSPLFEAIKSRLGNVKTIRTKLTAASKANLNQKNELGDTPLIVAASEGSLEVVTALLEAGANPNVKGNDDGTALDWAATKGRTEIVKKLAEYGADMTPIFDSWIGHLDATKQDALQVAFTEGKALYENKLKSGAVSAGGGRTRRRRLHKLPKRHRLRTRRRHAHRLGKRNGH